MTGNATILNQLAKELEEYYQNEKIVAIHLQADQIIIRNCIKLTSVNIINNDIQLISNDFELTIDKITNIEFESFEYHSYIISMENSTVYIDFISD